MLRKLIPPTEEEDAIIQAGIDADPDTYEPSDEEFKQARRAGRPPSPDKKQQISLRLAPKLLERWRATGPGWMTRMEQVLAEAVAEPAKKPKKNRA